MCAPSKNGDPRAVFLPPHLVATLANHPRGLERGDSRVFRFHQGGGLRNLLVSACALASGQAKPRREKRSGQPIKQAHGLDWVNFHTFCHTYATWMRRYAGLDTKGLVGTGRWRSEQSASRYAHVVPSEDARAASGLPDQKAHLALQDLMAWIAMSPLSAPKADMCSAKTDVRFVPIADIRTVGATTFAGASPIRK